MNSYDRLFLLVLSSLAMPAVAPAEENVAPVFIQWGTSYSGNIHRSGPVIIANKTDRNNTYKVTIADSKNRRSPPISDPLLLPANTLCALDRASFNLAPSKSQDFLFHIVRGNSEVLDITNPKSKIANAPYAHPGLEGKGLDITICTNAGANSCATGLWGSMSVGLANLGFTDISSDLWAREVRVIQNFRWHAGLLPGQSFVFNERNPDWHNAVALLQLQGSTDGSHFDAIQATPAIEEIESAQPCSTYRAKNNP